MTIENINCREELEHVIEYAVNKAKCEHLQHRAVGYAVNSVEFYKYVGYPCHVNIVLGESRLHRGRCVLYDVFREERIPVC